MNAVSVAAGAALLCINFNTYVDKYKAYYYTINKLTREG